MKGPGNINDYYCRENRTALNTRMFVQSAGIHSAYFSSTRAFGDNDQGRDLTRSSDRIRLLAWETMGQRTVAYDGRQG
jgi:hypothetical protein